MQDKFSFLNRIRKYDYFPKFQEDVIIKTWGGAIVSLFALFFMVILFLSEFSLYLQVVTNDHLVVDTIKNQKMRINIDISFPMIPCNLLSLDVMDITGSQVTDVEHTMKKIRINNKGEEINKNPTVPVLGTLTEKDLQVLKNKSNQSISLPNAEPICKSCYGAETPARKCCNTCSDVKRAYQEKGWAFTTMTHQSISQCTDGSDSPRDYDNNPQKGEGCRMNGFILVKKVAGNFHFAPGKSFTHLHMHIHDLSVFDSETFNISHQIHHLSFGEKYPGIINPLDNTFKLWEKDSGGIYQYYTKIVATRYIYLDSSIVDTNQYSVTRHQMEVREGHGVPGAFFFYDPSPIMVIITEEKKNFLHFLTQVCAIIGGVFTVAGLIDRTLFTAIKSFEKNFLNNKMS